MVVAHGRRVTGASEQLDHEFKAAFQRMAATVAVVSYYTHDRRPVGMTATSVCSLSPIPPSLVICVNRDTATHEEIELNRRFGVNILSSGQESVAEYCSRPGQHKALPADWLAPSADAGSPALENALAHLDCEAVQVYPQSTHSIVVGNVTSIQFGPERDPLMYCNRRYRDLRGEAQAESLNALWDRIGFGTLS